MLKIGARGKGSVVLVPKQEMNDVQFDDSPLNNHEWNDIQVYNTLNSQENVIPVIPIPNVLLISLSDGS